VRLVVVGRDTEIRVPTMLPRLNTCTGCNPEEFVQKVQFGKFFPTIPVKLGQLMGVTRHLGFYENLAFPPAPD